MLRAEPEASTTLDRSHRETWPEVVVVSAALLLLLTSYRTIVEGSAWFVTSVLVVALVTLAIVVMRLIGMRLLTAPLALLVELVVVGWVFAPQTLLVVVPTPDTFSVLAHLVDRAGTIIVNEQAPVAAAQPIVLTVAASFGGLVVLADLLLRTRVAALAIGVLLLAVFITPAMITGSTASPWLFVAVAAVWLALLRLRTTIGTSTRRARQVPAVLMGAGGLLAAMLFPAVSPDISAVAAAWGNSPPQVFGRGINPMIELGTNLRRNSPVTVLTYRTGLADPPYLKVATLTDFTGKTWKPDNDYRWARFEGRLQVDNGIKTEELETDITIANLRSTLLPVPYPATAIEGYKGQIRWERTGQTIEVVNGDSRDQKYTARSLQITPTADQLRAASPNVPYDIAPMTELTDPSEALDAIASTAREVTADAHNNFDRVMALQSYLRSSEFTYSESAPVRDDYDGNGIDVLAEFLQKKAGYCVHFSSAMAVMARSLRIPARIAVGYTPGTRGRFIDGEPTYTVRSDNLHAWTEIWFAGVGWVRFDPTPSVGEASTFEEEQTSSSSGDESSDSSSGEESRAEEDTVPVEETAPTDVAEPTSSVDRSAYAVAVGVLLVLGLPWLARAARRRWRLRDSGRADPPWREVEDTARDLGLPTPLTQTPRAFAGRLSSREGIDGEALDRLLGAVERSRYGRSVHDAPEAAADARQVIDSLLSGASRLERWRARILPRSLAGRGGAVLEPPGAEPLPG